MKPTLTTDADVVRTAYDLLDQVEAGTTTAATLERELADTMRAEFGTVGTGPDDPLWSLHLDVCRQFLAAGGLTSNELREWLSVRLRAENCGAAPVDPVPDATPISDAVEPAPEPDDLADVPDAVIADAEAAAQAVIDGWRAGPGGVTE